MGPKILLLLCLAVALRSGYCESRSSVDDERARLPEFLTELDLASLEASEEDIEALKTVVKRLAPEKNGEYQVYQGVMGQPGVDFPALTTIPTTAFSCRGLKGGYYADLETNCQVFHICDNGRKISFLCPNGTIFQQSQLICDWWFKVDCSKSAELYEQSAEQLAEEERKRTDAKRMNSEFHRTSGENEDNVNGQKYYQSENTNYDGRQNGRSNPFSQTSNKNLIPGSIGQRGQNTDYKSTTRGFDPNQIYNSNGVTPNQYNQINELATGNGVRGSQDVTNNGQSSNNNKGRSQYQQHQSSGRTTTDRGNYRPVDRQQNQLVEVSANEESKRHFNYEQRGASRYTGSNQNAYHNQQQQPVRSNQQTADYSSSSRNVGRGGGDNERTSFGKSGSVPSFVHETQTSNRVTPSYTETTTFRTSTSSPIREYQQLAESAAFATNRGNRFNEAYSSSQFNSYYNNFNDNPGGNSNANNNDNNNNANNNNNNKSKSRVQQKTTERPRQKSITTSSATDKVTGNFLRVRVGPPASLPFPTFQPIYKPRTSNGYSSTDYDTTTLSSTITDTVTTTSTPYTDYYTSNNQDRTTYADNLDYRTTTSYPETQESQGRTETTNTEILTEDYPRNSVTPSSGQTFTTSTDFYENTTPTIITSGTYVNAKAYTSNKVQASGYKASSAASGFTTSRPYSKSQEYRQNSVVTTEPINESTVRRSDANSNQVTTSANYRDVTVDQNTVGTKSLENLAQQTRTTGKNTPRTGSTYRQSVNSISTSTEKPLRSTTAVVSTGFTGKTLSPYDTSFTYQQGKVMSTLGPYLPFTKNYAYSTTTTTTTTSTTAKPTAYTATVPAYSSTGSFYRASSAKSLGKVRVSTPSTRPTSRLRSGSAAYLPEKKSDVTTTYFAKKHGLSGRPLNEREHAMSMIQSLRGLDGTVPTILGVGNNTRSGLHIPTSSGPSTLHSLALYFATAGDDFDVTAESRTDSTAESDSTEITNDQDKTRNKVSKESTSVELPTSILTQHTINSYAELFNLNNALEGNSSSEVGFEGDGTNEETDDLDIQQSEGPIEGARKSNSTRLRELAQVFTHALSAYLQDPDTFKKILTEIRPTEPTTIGDDERFTATTFVPTTSEDYPSVTKEKDEVLDFSDDTTPPRGRRPTTVYPGTTDPPATTEIFNQQEYYTTSGDYYTTPSTSAGNSNESGPGNNFAFQVNDAFATASSGGNELNNGPTGGVYYPEEAVAPSDTTGPDGVINEDRLGDYGDNYFPSDDSAGNKIGGFQNNSQSSSTYEPYGKNVKPFDATPIHDNYVASSTPATYVQTRRTETTKSKGVSKQSYSVVTGVGKPLNFRQPDNTRNSQNSLNSNEERKPEGVTGKENSQKSSTEPFRIRYYDTTTPRASTNNRESLVTADTIYSKYHENRNDLGDRKEITERPDFIVSVQTSRTTEPFTSYTTGSFETITNNADVGTTFAGDNTDRQNDRKLNDHWTSSPTVTQLWESTVFVDPKRINQGLVSGTPRDTGFELSTLDYTESTQTPSPFSNNDNNDKNVDNVKKNKESLITDATSSGLSSHNTNDLDYPSSPWKWSSSSTTGQSENDSPTAFTLLPQTNYPTGEKSVATGTPSPIYTTRSSITTTITSSVTSTTSDGKISPRQEGFATPIVDQESANRPKHGIAINDRSNEITRAHEMFGKLNTTSTNTLMKVMKQADTNATVRQLVLLLINHCNGPMNKTMEEEKEQLLDALLRMPVNEFTTEESRDLIAGINRLNLPIGKNAFSTVVPSSTTTTTTTMASSTSTEEPIVTTFRSKKGRRFKNTSEETSSASPIKKNEDIATAESGNLLSSDETTASDARALELLRSLYTIAAKWG